MRGPMPIGARHATIRRAPATVDQDVVAAALRHAVRAARHHGQRAPMGALHRGQRSGGRLHPDERTMQEAIALHARRALAATMSNVPSNDTVMEICAS